MKVTRFAVMMIAALALATLPAAAQLGSVTGAVNSTLGGQASAQHGNSGLGVGLGSETQGTLGADASGTLAGVDQSLDSTANAAAQTMQESAQQAEKATDSAAAQTKAAADATAGAAAGTADKTAEKAESTSVKADGSASSSTSVQAGGNSAAVDSNASANVAGAVNANAGADKQKGMDRAETRGNKNAKSKQAIERNEARQDAGSKHQK